MTCSRPALALGLLGTIAGCGGGNGPTPPPPPPPAANPASVTVLAGTGQVVPAGQAAPIAPAVTVRDAQGNPFAGAPVVFAVAEGGGTLDGATQVTDGAGVARVTRWTVGTSGAQRVTATVGSLAPASFAATLVPGTESLVQVIPPAGGAVAVTTPGHPYQGLTLTIPAATFPAAVNWSLRALPNVPAPVLPAGYRAGGPLLEIATDAGWGAALMTLEVPLSLQPGESAVLVFIDPARGVMEVLPTVARSATSIRVVTRHLRADRILGPPAVPGALRSALRAEEAAGQLLPVIITSLPQPSVPPVYDQSVFGVPVVDHGSVALPDGFGAAIPALQVVAAASGSGPLGASVRALYSPDLSARDLADAGVLRVLQDVAETPGINTAELQDLVSRLLGLPKAERDGLVGQNITASLALTGKPGLVAAFKSVSGPTESEVWFANAIASANDALTTTQAANPAAQVLARGTGGFEGLDVKKTGDGLAGRADGVVHLPSFVFNHDVTTEAQSALERYRTVFGVDRQALNEEIIHVRLMLRPRYEVERVRGAGFVAEPSRTLVVRGDPLVIRAQGALTVHSTETGAHLATGDAGGLDLSGFVDPANGSVASVIINATETVAGKVRQLLPEQLNLVRARFVVAPDTARITADSSTVEFEADVPMPPDAGFRIRWTWGDGTTTDELGLTSVSHHYDTPGNYTATATLLSADGAVVLALDSMRIEYEVGPQWRLTSIENVDSLGVADILAATGVLAAAVADPGAAMIAVEDSGPGTELRLRVVPGGTWDAGNCCNPGSPPRPGEVRAILGAAPTRTTAVGIYFFGYGDSRWSQSTEDLGAGTMTSQWAEGTFVYNVRNQGQQVGPRYALRLSATRTGTTMTGTITLTFWPILGLEPGESVMYVDNPDVYRFPFTARRIR